MNLPTTTTVTLTGVVTHAGADPDHTGRGLLIERTRTGVLYHRFDTPLAAMQMRDRYHQTGEASFPGCAWDGFLIYQATDIGPDLLVERIRCTLDGDARERVLFHILRFDRVRCADHVYVVDVRDRDDEVVAGA